MLVFYNLYSAPQLCHFSAALYQVNYKNQLVTTLLDYLMESDPQMSDDLASILEELTTLNRTENSKVSLRARQVRSSEVFFSLTLYL